jgi:hypothetical protein
MVDEEGATMTILSEDPTILGGGLAILGLVFLAALRATQQGKYLALAGTAFGLALVILATERLWVTDNERIEQVVYALRDAVANSDADGVLEHLAPKVQYDERKSLLSPEETRSMIRSRLSSAAFDFVRVSQLRTNVGRQSRRGTAEFRLVAKGRLDSSVGTITIGTAGSEWSLVFQEVEPHVWKVSRITPVSIPGGIVPRAQPSLPNRDYGPSHGRFRRQ